MSCAFNKSHSSLKNYFTWIYTFFTINHW